MAQAFKIDVFLKVEQNGRNAPEFNLDSDLDGEITLKDLLDFTKESLIVFADEALREEQSLGFDKTPVIVVDGKPGLSPRYVHPLGQIEFVARQNFLDILIDAYQGLLDRSKVYTGKYKASHYVFLNGQQVATSMSSLRVWIKNNPELKNNDVIRIINIQPYARRLERLGVTAQRSRPRRREKRKKGAGTGVFFNVPNGAYQLTFRSLQSKYKRNVSIKFSFISGGELGLSGSFKSGRAGRNSAGRPYLYPSLVFKIEPGGLTNV
jgi:hypothetical protein